MAQTLPPDEPPKDSRWVDVHDVLEQRSEQDEERGRLMGERIDPEDDDDVDGGVQ